MPPQEDRAMATGDMHRNLVKIVAAVPEICSRTNTHRDRQIANRNNPLCYQGGVISAKYAIVGSDWVAFSGTQQIILTSRITVNRMTSYILKSTILCYLLTTSSKLIDISVSNVCEMSSDQLMSPVQCSDTQHH